MPKLLTKPQKRRKIPPCGRIIEYQPPHSPWQKLVDGARLARNLTFGQLAEAVGVNKGTLWGWLHNKNGFPHPKSFKPAHLEALAKVLKLKPAELRETLDASRHLYTDRETPSPVDSRDALATLIQVLENDGRKTISRSYVLNLARRLHRGDPAPPGPKESQ